MMEALKQWHGWYVTERWEPAFEPPLVRPFVQEEKLPGFRCSRIVAPPLGHTRTQLEHTWNDLNQVVDNEIALDFCCSGHHRLLKDTRHFLDEQSMAPQRYYNEAYELEVYVNRALNESKRIIEVLNLVIELLRDYAGELELLSMFEKEAVEVNRLITADER